MTSPPSPPCPAGAWQLALPQSVVRVSGADAATFLHAQLVSHVLKLSTGDVIRTAWCTPQGRVSFLFWLLKTADDFLLVLPASEQPRLVPRLRMFVLRAQVAIESLEGRWSVYGSNLPLDDERWGAGEGILHQPARDIFTFPCGSLGRRLCLGPADVLAHWAPLTALPVADASCWQACDIAELMAEVTGPLVNAFLPQQLNLDVRGTLAFDKGCYPGQEIIARLKYRGEVKARLQTGTSSEALQAGWRLLPSDAAPTGGTVVQSAAAPDGKFLVLAVADLGAQSHTLATAERAQAPVHFLAREPGAA